MRWAIRFIGLLNTIITARLVLPKDYGIVAMAMLAVGLIKALIDLGVGTALIRLGEVSRADIDSAWSLRLIQTIVGVLLMLALAYPASAYFNEPDVVWVLVAIAVATALSGLSNIGLVLAQKSLNFALEFKVSVSAKLVSVAVTILCAWLLGDYRALVAGICAGMLTEVVLSYALHSYRPAFNLSSAPMLWRTTKWLVFGSAATFLLRRGDEVLVGRLGNSADFGLYNVGSDLGQMPAGEIGPAILKSLLPVLSTIQDDHVRTNQAMQKVLGTVNTVTLPIGFIFAGVATPAVAVLLGPNWAEAAVYVAIFAVLSPVYTISTPFNALLILRGHARLPAVNIWIEFALFVVACLALYPIFDLLALAVARLVSGMAYVGLAMRATQRHCEISLYSCAAALWRPIICSAIACASAIWIVSHFSSSVVSLVLGATGASAVYCISITVLWFLSGKPNSGEVEVCLTLRSAVQSRFRRL